MLDPLLAADATIVAQRYNAAIVNLRRGNYRDGFRDYEYRLLLPNKQPYFGLPFHRKWDGRKSIEGKHLWVVGEQGVGDVLMFLRFVPQLVARGAEVYLSFPAPISPLVAMDGVRTDEPSSHWDYWIPLASLPYLLRVEHQVDIPLPYRPPIERRAECSGTGMCWQGNPANPDDATRSLSFSAVLDWSRVLSLPDPQVALQWDGRSSWAETADVIAGLKCVLSVDTAVAHLAASMDVPTFLLVPQINPHWPWGESGERTPWYPSMQLVRMNERSC